MLASGVKAIIQYDLSVGLIAIIKLLSVEEIVLNCLIYCLFLVVERLTFTASLKVNTLKVLFVVEVRM